MGAKAPNGLDGTPQNPNAGRGYDGRYPGEDGGHAGKPLPGGQGADGGHGAPSSGICNIDIWQWLAGLFKGDDVHQAHSLKDEGGQY